ncbi:3'5'-cyclic nucleotide phosphodiesterase catalytic domain [Trinorchestia longiramus]|nr:3'5'-cyclic nucleotide phosphodiesterase catalytic domain [Trinorchestia longiramus]
MCSSCDASALCNSSVTKEEVEKLTRQQVPEPTKLHPDFFSFSFFPRVLPELSTPLAVISMMTHLGIPIRWSIPSHTLARFVLMVRKGYRDPPYHNWVHAFSVTHFAFLLINNLALCETGVISHMEALALMVSCLCHDLDHRGTTNSFQVDSNSVLASLYSSEGSVMERHHLAQTMCILNTESCNIFENLSKEEYTQCLDLMRDIILATDLAHHLRLVGELRQMAKDGYDSSNPRHRHLCICLLMTSADLSDQTKLRDFLVLPCKRKLQYITSSIDEDQVLRKTFDKVQTPQQKNVFLLVDEVQIRPTVSFSGGLLSSMAENNQDCKATSILITRRQGTVRVKERQYSNDYYTHSICCQPLKFAVNPSEKD